MPLRVRLMLIGLAGLGIAVGVGSFVLYAVVTHLATSQLDTAARATATQVGGLVSSGRLPDPLPLTAAQLVQVVDGRDRVLSASPNADRLTALLVGAELGRTPLVVDGLRAGVSGPLRVLAVPVTAADGRSRDYVVVAQSYADVLHTNRVLRWSLLVTFPLLLLVLGLIAWRVIGAALRPVEGLRAGAARITGDASTERLPVPPTRDEVAALASTLNDMLDRLADSRGRQRAFVADAAHELRSPLASMRAQLEVAERVGAEPSLPADLLAEVARMSALVEDLLVLARLDAGVRAARSETDLAEVVAQLDFPLLHSDVGACVVAAPEAHLHRILLNLLGNASRHAASRVELAAHQESGSVVITVDDDGPGIPAAERDRVFERFTRLDDARSRDDGGSGLGLAIVRGLVDQSGGTVSLADSALGGLRVVVRLPEAPGVFVSRNQ